LRLVLFMFISFVGNICDEALKDQIYMIEVGLTHLVSTYLDF